MRGKGRMHGSDEFGKGLDDERKIGHGNVVVVDEERLWPPR